MNILIFEYITGGGLQGHPLPAALAGEGEMMLQSVVKDFQQLPGCRISTLRDRRLGDGVSGANTVFVEHGEHYMERLEELASNMDALLVIAPENDGVLLSLCERFSSYSLMLFNCKTETIKLTSNKYSTYRYLQAHGVPQIPTCLAKDACYLEGEQFVMKPFDGVGCDRISLLRNKSELQAASVCADRDRFIFQPYIQGVHASLSLLCLQGECLIMSCNEQHIVDENGRLKWLKCKVNAFKRNRFMPFARELVRTLPGLQGYVGIDIIISNEKILLVEINPRLTTSYAGLSAALLVNPAELILECFQEKLLPDKIPVSSTAVMVNLEVDAVA